LAASLALRVLPVPGGPHSNIPLGIPNPYCAEAVYYGAQDLLGNAISLEMYRKNKNGNGNGHGYTNGNGNKFDWNEWKELFPKVLGFSLDRLASMSPEQQERAVKAIANLVSKYIYMGQTSMNLKKTMTTKMIPMTMMPVKMTMTKKRKNSQKKTSPNK